jgi:hypothetical protein
MPWVAEDLARNFVTYETFASPADDPNCVYAIASAISRPVISTYPLRGV